MLWKAIYSDGVEYNSSAYDWVSLPNENFIKLTITLPKGGKMGVSGWDFYALEKLENGLKVSFWKDVIANDINGIPIHEPYLNKGCVREFYNDGTANKVEYFDADVVYKNIPKNLIKAGIWVEDDLAKELGVL